MSSTLVLGMGNPILSDDGVGLLVAERLRRTSLPAGVEVARARSPGCVCSSLCADSQASSSSTRSRAGEAAEPGEIVRFEAKDFRGGQR